MKKENSKSQLTKYIFQDQILAVTWSYAMSPGHQQDVHHDHDHHEEDGEDGSLATYCYFNLSDCRSASTDGSKSNFNTKDFAFR